MHFSLCSYKNSFKTSHSFLSNIFNQFKQIPVTHLIYDLHQSWEYNHEGHRINNNRHGGVTSNTLEG
jgi:hypothetical protein